VFFHMCLTLLNVAMMYQYQEPTRLRGVCGTMPFRERLL
jgi:hypothetical protein